MLQTRWNLLYAVILCLALSEVRSEYDQHYGFPKATINMLSPARRPVTSMRILTEDPQFYRGPEPKDLNPQKLMKLLGNDYDPKYTAMTEQEVQRRRKEEFLRNLKKDDSPEQQVYRKFLVHSMPQRIKDLDFTMPGLRRNLGPRASRKLQLWLWKMSSCPVYSKWKYFGKRFWPPYRNVGRCGKKPTCSFPRGMKCKKAATKVVPSLRWICIETPTSPSCKWMKMDLRVISKCQCTCAHSKSKDD